MQVPAMWPGYEMSAGGFKLSAAPCMHYFHGNSSFQLPVSCWLKALQCFVLRLQRRETISLLPQHSTRDGSSSWEQKPCLQHWGGLGRREAEQRGWTSFSGGKQHFPHHAEVHTLLPALHSSTSNMCLCLFYHTCQFWVALQCWEEKCASLEMRNLSAASMQGSLQDGG